MAHFEQWLHEKRNEVLKQLNGAQGNKREFWSSMLVDLGVAYNGTTTDGITYFEPAPWVYEQARQHN